MCLVWFVLCYYLARYNVLRSDWLQNSVRQLDSDGSANQKTRIHISASSYKKISRRKLKSI